MYVTCENIDICIHKMWDINIMHDKQRIGKMKGMNFNKKE